MTDAHKIYTAWTQMWNGHLDIADELLSPDAFGLHPIESATASIRPIEALRHDAFEAELACLLPCRGSGFGERGSEAQRIACARQELRQDSLALGQRARAQVLAIPFEDVERVEHERRLEFPGEHAL